MKDRCFYDIIRNKIDPILDSPFDSSELIDLLKKREYFYYFIVNIKNPDWIPILSKYGLLNYKEKHHLYYLQYDYFEKILAKGNRQYDEIVIKSLETFAKNYNPTGSAPPLNYSRIVSISSYLVDKYADETFELVLWSLKANPWVHDIVLNSLDSYFIALNKNKCHSQFKKLFKTVYSTKKIKEKYFNYWSFDFKYDSYSIMELYNKIESILLTDFTSDYFKILIDDYENTLKSIFPQKEDSDVYDSTYISRPSISDSEQNSGYSSQDTMVNILKNIIDHIEDNKSREVFLNILAEKKYPIFRRFGLYILKEYSDLIPKYERYFITEKNFTNICVSHEMHTFLRTNFKDLVDNRKESVLKYINDANLNFKNKLSSQEENKVKKDWQLGLLESMQSNYSENAELNQKILTLKDELGYSPSHPEYPVMTTSSSGFDTPIERVDLEKMDWKEIKEYLLAFDDKTVDLTFKSRPEYEGLAQKFGALIKSKPDEFIQYIDLFKDSKLRLCYLRTISESLAPQINLYKRKIITSNIDYLLWLWGEIQNGLETEQEGTIYSIFIAFKRMFSHLHDTLHNDENEINRADIKTIERLLILFNPKIVNEELSLKDPYQDFINSTYGEYLMVWFALSLRLRRRGELSDMHNEFRVKIENGLEGKDAFIHVLLGRYLPNFYYIESNWLIEVFKLIFPVETDIKMWTYAFKGFMWSRSTKTELFELLIPTLSKACEINLENDQRRHLADAIGSYYLDTKTHMECHNRLIMPLSMAGTFNSDLSNNLMWFFGQRYNEVKNGKMIRRYVEFRFTILQDKKLFKEKNKEMIQFISLYKCYNDLNERQSRIFEKAISIFTEERGFPKILIEFYDQLFKNEQFDYLIKFLEIEFNKPKKWPVSYDKEYKTLFTNLYQLGNVEYSEVISKIINFLGEQFDYRFRDLYEMYGNK